MLSYDALSWRSRRKVLNSNGTSSTNSFCSSVNRIDFRQMPRRASYSCSSIPRVSWRNLFIHKMGSSSYALSSLDPAVACLNPLLRPLNMQTRRTYSTRFLFLKQCSGTLEHGLFLQLLVIEKMLRPMEGCFLSISTTFALLSISLDCFTSSTSLLFFFASYLVNSLTPRLFNFSGSLKWDLFQSESKA